MNLKFIASTAIVALAVVLGVQHYQESKGAR